MITKVGFTKNDFCPYSDKVLCDIHLEDKYCFKDCKEWLVDKQDFSWKYFYDKEVDFRVTKYMRDIKTR